MTVLQRMQIWNERQFAIKVELVRRMGMGVVEEARYCESLRGRWLLCPMMAWTTGTIVETYTFSFEYPREAVEFKLRFG
jgi:hypothetical protein